MSFKRANDPLLNSARLVEGPAHSGGPDDYLPSGIRNPEAIGADADVSLEALQGAWRRLGISEDPTVAFVVSYAGLSRIRNEVVLADDGSPPIRCPFGGIELIADPLCGDGYGVPLNRRRRELYRRGGLSAVLLNWDPLSLNPIAPTSSVPVVDPEHAETSGPD